MSALRILVVEDEPLIAELLAEVLVGMGHAICAIVSTESDAVVAATRSRPDLMIVDHHLEQGSGAAAVTKILRSGYIPYVIASGDWSEARKLWPHAVVLRKPYDTEDLAYSVETAMKATAGPSGTPVGTPIVSAGAKRIAAGRSPAQRSAKRGD
jgi:CheY-like chemotaxis protein